MGDLRDEGDHVQAAHGFADVVLPRHPQTAPYGVP